MESEIVGHGTWGKEIKQQSRDEIIRALTLPTKNESNKKMMDSHKADKGKSRPDMNRN